MNIKRLSILTITISFGLALIPMWFWLLALPPGPTQAASYTVCPAGPPTCDYSLIQDAVDAAVTGEVIKVATGTYTDVNDYGGGTQVIYISKTVTIRGGYTSAFDEPPDPEANPTTLDAGGQGRVIYITGNISPTIEGLRITGGEAKDLGSPIGGDSGGGILIVSATAMIKDNYIFENAVNSINTEGEGGGVFLLDSDATLEGNTIISNTATNGGGVRLYNSDAILTGNTISANTAIRAGGIFMENSDATLSNNIISSNSALANGGLRMSGGSPTLRDNTIISNTSTLYDNGGLYMLECENARLTGNTISYNSAARDVGGLSVDGTNILVSGNTISFNTGDWGGGISLSGDNIIVSGNVIYSNTANSGEGGGVSLTDGNIYLIGNTIISNTAGGGGGIACCGTGEQIIDANFISGNYGVGEGGGIFLNGGNPILTNNIIVNNRTDGGGSAIVLSGGATLSHLVHNTISQNHGGNGYGIFIYGGAVAMTNTIIVSHTVGIQVTPGAAATLESTLWGAATWANDADWAGEGTIMTGTVNIRGDPDFVDYLAGNYHIGENSDAIDAGIEAGVTRDIDFHPRPYQAPDIGADEYWPPGALTYVHLPVIVR